MVIFSYNLSPKIRENLTQIESLRRQILLTPLPPRFELQLKWEAAINRIYWSLALIESPLSRREIVKLLAQNKKYLKKEAREAVSYKRALDYIAGEWLVNLAPTQLRHILHLHSLAHGFIRLNKREYENPGVAWNRCLDYLARSRENPVIQAGIAQVNLEALSPIPHDDGRTARLIGLLFLYKFGYDFRGLLEIEEYFRADFAGYKRTQESAKTAQNLTFWLEYYTQSLKSQLFKMTEKINSGRTQINTPRNFWRLTDRQKTILEQIARPDQSINNKKVQNLFGVSQITASRDLAKLLSLGLLFSHGRGRSVYYTRV